MRSTDEMSVIGGEGEGAGAERGDELRLYAGSGRDEAGSDLCRGRVSGSGAEYAGGAGGRGLDGSDGAVEESCGIGATGAVGAVAMGPVKSGFGAKNARN